MTGFGKFFILIGVLFIMIGLIWSFIGKLPGDITIKTGNTTFYFPIVTSIVVSIILSVIFMIIGRFK
ncbi:DUF2905 domain-containing protein [Alkalibacillus sp. S2W]|uniref:Uncharacterized protein HemY n=1 Tax=Alkalibacillus salilacus TaxID=284582 RepID=A0ABT9VCP0_9BACI|nr:MULTISPECIES: DUF2905 domain-containing protein [Alkalibacillus]MDQ0158740.1 uncharacterized protein HemY [Alkalibacillus salilacus]NIK11259.1 uncharacterized protein HemY [Alkalibacillus almallahensis]